MFGSDVLETAIGLVLVYLLLSLICSAINEAIARLLALRSSTLQQGIETMLRDPALVTELYKHPLIDTQYRPSRFDRLVGRDGKPSYISPDTFALTLIDVLRTRAAAATPATVGATPTVAAAPQVNPPTATEVIQAIQSIPDSQLKQVLLLLAQNVQGDYTRLKQSIAQWYDDTMKRVSGWYKRKVQLLLLLVSFLVTAAVGADTLTIGSSFWRDPTLRAAAVAAAQQTVKHPLPSTTTPLTEVVEAQTELNQLKLPIGWTARPANIQDWLKKLAGLLLTTIALSFGAPFWFDVLNRVANLRETGPKPDGAQTTS